VIRGTVYEDEPAYAFWQYKAGFAMTGVPSITKMYRTPANSEIHSVLHLAEKTKVYSVHFDLKNYTLLQRVMHTIELKVTYKNQWILTSCVCFYHSLDKVFLFFLSLFLDSRIVIFVHIDNRSYLFLF
jgi:hypothetical protein